MAADNTVVNSVHVSKLMLARRWSVAVLLVVDRDLFVRTVADISDAVQNQKAMQEQCGWQKKENSLER